MADHDVTNAAVDELIAIMAEAAQAFIGGDMARYFELMHHTDDFTLMPPTGGDVSRDSENSPEQVAEMARFFKRGECTLEVVETYASGNLAVLVAVEHQHGEVGAYPDQDWSLRVTLVFRREESGWRLAHRHADALVHPITFDQLAELARGRAPQPGSSQVTGQSSGRSNASVPPSQNTIEPQKKPASGLNR